MGIVLVSLLLTLSRCFPIDKAIGKKWSHSIISDAHTTLYGIYSKLTIKTPKRQHQRHLMSFFVDLE